jgi:hypothetical protein
VNDGKGDEGVDVEVIRVAALVDIIEVIGCSRSCTQAYGRPRAAKVISEPQLYARERGTLLVETRQVYVVVMPSAAQADRNMEGKWSELSGPKVNSFEVSFEVSTTSLLKLDPRPLRRAAVENKAKWSQPPWNECGKIEDVHRRV